MAGAVLLGLTAQACWSCACGCGVFGVGTSSMIPNHAGGMAYIEYDSMNQSHNWSGTSGAPGSQNPDKDIRTGFFTAGLQYMFNRSWGFKAEVPYWDRSFTTTDNGNSTSTFHHPAIGDIRLNAIYSGFEPNMSTGVTFGLKLPTGDYTYPGFDRDTEIGTGSTDILVGGYHMDALTKDNSWSWFMQANLDYPFATHGGYRPGTEIDAAYGIFHDMGPRGPFRRVAPLIQIIGSGRASDSGSAADPENTGYTRLLISPGIEASTGKTRLYADVEFPVYQNITGNQLVAPVLFKLIVGRSF